MKTMFFALLFLLAMPCYANGNWIDPFAGQSKASAASLDPLINLTAISAELANSKLTVKSLNAVGGLIEVVAISAVSGASIVWNISAATLKLSGLVVGTSIIVTTVSGGYLLMAGSEALAFIPNEISRAHIHHRKLSQ